MQEEIWKYFSIFLLVILILLGTLFVFQNYSTSATFLNTNKSVENVAAIPFDKNALAEGSESEEEEEEMLDDPKFTSLDELVELSSR
jgi:hypothetical protein